MLQNLFVTLTGREVPINEDLFFRWLTTILSDVELFAVARRYGFSNKIAEIPDANGKNEVEECERAINKLLDAIDRQYSLGYCGTDLPKRLALTEALESKMTLNMQLSILDKYTSRLEDAIDRMLSSDLPCENQQKDLRDAESYRKLLETIAT